MISISFIMQDGSQRDVDAEPGQTLLKSAHQNQIYDIEGACGGAMACSTCHVIIDPTWYKKLPSPSADETDMLDLANGLSRTSRLAWQSAPVQPCVAHGRGTS